MLELTEDKLRDDKRPLHEARLADVGDPAVDDDRGVQDLVSFETRLLFHRTEQVKDAESPPLLHRHCSGDVAYGNHEEQLEEAPDRLGQGVQEDRQSVEEPPGEKESDKETNNTADEGFDLDSSQDPLYEQCAHARGHPPAETEEQVRVLGLENRSRRQADKAAEDHEESPDNLC